MKTDCLGKGIQYQHTAIVDKHYFGGFVNLAENNIKLVFNLFRERFELKGTTLSNVDTAFKDDLATVRLQTNLDTFL